MESLTEFVEQYRAFKDKAKPIVEKEENLVTLFAIFRKDSRTEKIQPKNNNGDQPATEKQKRYLKGLLTKASKEGDVEIQSIDVDKLTKAEASGLIEQLRSD